MPHFVTSGISDVAGGRLATAFELLLTLSGSRALQQKKRALIHTHRVSPGHGSRVIIRPYKNPTSRGLLPTIVVDCLSFKGWITLLTPLPCCIRRVLTSQIALLTSQVVGIHRQLYLLIGTLLWMHRRTQRRKNTFDLP
jgi:hypothetical protein